MRAILLGVNEHDGLRIGKQYDWIVRGVVHVGRESVPSCRHGKCPDLLAAHGASNEEMAGRWEGPSVAAAAHQLLFHDARVAAECVQYDARVGVTLLQLRKQLERWLREGCITQVTMEGVALQECAVDVQTKHQAPCTHTSRTRRWHTSAKHPIGCDEEHANRRGCRVCSRCGQHKILTGVWRRHVNVSYRHAALCSGARDLNLQHQSN
mmetsp:Transcript_34434/g.80633  ORF Transcript_34434/g.80633 Transcript_34434/m.80633 type:complete len:209 (+) Transcript_34434:622-1248(+)